jgi:hypothetical protein
MTEETTTGPRRIAVVSDLAGLHAAIREWVAELNVSRATIDHVGGLPDGHASKLLAPAPLKHFGHVSLGLMLGACGLDLWVMVNDEKLRQLGGRLPPRQSKRWLPSQAWDGLYVRKLARSDLAAWGRAGGQARSKLPKGKLRQLQRRAARARWRRQNNQPS